MECPELIARQDVPALIVGNQYGIERLATAPKLGSIIAYDEDRALPWSPCVVVWESPNFKDDRTVGVIFPLFVNNNELELGVDTTLMEEDEEKLDSICKCPPFDDFLCHCGGEDKYQKSLQAQSAVSSDYQYTVYELVLRKLNNPYIFISSVNPLQCR